MLTLEKFPKEELCIYFGVRLLEDGVDLSEMDENKKVGRRLRHVSESENSGSY